MACNVIAHPNDAYGLGLCGSDKLAEKMKQRQTAVVGPVSH